MREDIKYVVIERPRNGHKDRIYKISRNKVKEEDLPSFEAIGKYRGHYYKSKYLSDFLSPIIRFLNKSVGRKWNDVYSEIKQVLKSDSTLKIHVTDHIKDFVATDIERIGEKVYRVPYKTDLRDGEFFVEDGSLKKYKREKIAPKKELVVTKHIGNQVLEKLDKVWYILDKVWVKSSWEPYSESYVYKPCWECSRKWPPKECNEARRVSKRYGEVVIVKEKELDPIDALNKAIEILNLYKICTDKDYMYKKTLADLKQVQRNLKQETVVRTEEKYYLVGKNKRQLSSKELKKYGIK